MSTEDTIGVVVVHRWASREEQRERLKADGCRVIVDLKDVGREYLLGSIRDGAGTCVKVLFAFLLAKPGGAMRMLADYRTFAEKIAKLPRGAHGWIKDVDSGFAADTPGKRKAMLAVVKEQIARHRKGRSSRENGKRGRAPLVLTELQEAKGQAIWLNLNKYRTREAAERALQEQVHKDLTHWSANRRWGPRQFGAKGD